MMNFDILEKESSLTYLVLYVMFTLLRTRLFIYTSKV